MRERDIFIEALQRDDPADRAAYLSAACAGDEALHRLVEVLLAEHEKGEQFLLDSPPSLGNFAETIDHPAATPMGTVLGPYKLLQQIGEGGMGSVWMAQQTVPVRRLVALKLIKAGMDSKQVLARFEAERQALALMDHPNIAKVFDGGVVNTSPGDPKAGPGASGSFGRPYFVMELVKGVTITRYCDQHHLTPRQRLELFVPVCQAIQHAHQKGVIHRDLKPSNVLVALYDGKPVPKVIDFGIAKAAGQALTDKTLVTGFGAIVGTLEYMAPEQAEVNQLDIDTRSDIYSLGVLLYELLTGSTPFTKKDLENAGMLEMLRVIREQEPSKPSTKLSSALGLATLAANRGTEPAKLTRLVRGDLDWIVMKALEKDRSRRYETANGFAADVLRYLADEPVLARSPSVGYRLRKFSRRNRMALATASLFVILMVLLGASAGWYVRDRSTRRAVAAAEVEKAIVTAEELAGKRRLPEAVLHARSGQSLLDSAGGNDELREQVRELLNDLDLAARLEEARLEVARNLDPNQDDRNTMLAYATVFRDVGLDVQAQDSTQIIERIRCRPIRAYLMQALDYWASIQLVEPELKNRLLAILVAVDSDPWRAQVRAAQSDPAVLKRLAADPDVLSQSPASLCLLGDYLYRQGELDAAITLLTRAQRKYPDDFWINSDLANFVVRCRPSRWDQATRYLSVAVGLRPQSPGARVKLGWALDWQRRSTEAADMYRSAIDLNPKYIQARVQLGHLMLFIQDFEGARVQFSTALELNPKVVQCWLGRAAAFQGLGRWDAALADCAEAIKLRSEHPTAWFALGEAYRGMGKLDLAIANYSRAIQLKPDYLLARTHRRELFLQANAVDKAIDDLTELIELMPKDSQVRNTRVGLYRKLRRWNEAIADYTVLIEKHSTGDYHNRGWMYAETGRFREAAADFAKAIKRSPGLPAWWHDYAMACLGTGDRKAYADVCSRMLDRFGNTADPAVASTVVFTCVTAPDAATDRARLVKLAEIACTQNRPYHLSLFGAAYYRAGQPGHAVECFAERPRTPPRCRDWCFEAMVHHRLGQDREARDCLNAADKWLAIVGPPGPDDPEKPIPRWFNWQDETGSRQLRREADTLLKTQNDKSKKD